MSKIFITGATGLLGNYIAQKFFEKGYTIKALKRINSDTTHISQWAKHAEWIEGDIFDLEQLNASIEDDDIVVHSAALVSFRGKDRKAMMRTNVEGTANLVNVCLDKKIKKFVHISSIASLGRKKGRIEIDETSKWEDSDYNTHYAESKYLAELEVWRGIKEGLPAVILNPSLVFGVGDWSRTSLQLFKYVSQGKKFFPVGSCNYVDVRDIAQAALLLAESPIVAERFVLSAGNIFYKDLFAKIAKLMHKKAPFIPVSPFLAEIAWRANALWAMLTFSSPTITKETARNSSRHFIYKSDKIKKFFPEFTFHSLDDTLKWVIEQKETILAENI
ncbi:MAG: NAD-dependent epimerase/dehydratase family protein [Raineya sp.]